MNTHDIELPPITKPKNGGLFYERVDLKAFARAAIEADRKQKGVVVVTRTQDGEIVAVTRQDDEGRILSVIAEADRKRRVEPIANLWVNPETLEFEVDSCNHPIDELIPVYEAPQPAERSTGEPVARSIRYSLDQRIFDAAAKENDLVRLYIRETEEDEYSLDAHRALNDLYGASATLRELLIEHLNSDDAPQHAEPVKVPSKLSNAEILSLAYDVGAMPEQATDATLVRFARALLARYGSTTGEATKQQRKIE